MKHAAFCILFAVLCGCAGSRSNEDREAECEKMGFQPKTEQCALCVLSLIDSDNKRDQALFALLHNSGDGYSGSQQRMDNWQMQNAINSQNLQLENMRQQQFMQQSMQMR